MIRMARNKYIYTIKPIPLDNAGILLNEALFHNANGYIGIRYDFEEEYPEGYEFIRSQYINGFYDETEVSHPERLYGFIDEKQFMVDVANTQTIKVYLGNEMFTMFSGTVIDSSISLHMDKGVTVREVHWKSPSGKEILVKITRMTSFFQPSLFTIEYEITPLNFSDNLVIESVHEVDVENFSDPEDPRTAVYCQKCINPTNCEIRNGASYIGAITSRSTLQVYSGVKNVLSQEETPEHYVKDNTAICVFRPMAREGECITLRKYTVFCDSLRYENCIDQTYLEMDNATNVPLEKLYEQQEAYLKEFWDNCDVTIKGDKESDTALRYNMFQLLQSAGKDPYCSISPKGLSGEGYEGHYFWDSEMYIQPFFTITNPHISRNLIEFRYRTLEEAKENAGLLGHRKGALYPWRTINGKECSGYFPSGSAQYHINGAVAYAVIAYFLATGDEDFLIEKGAEIIFETARLWVDLACHYKGRYHLNDVTGPDEYTCIVNNNYYTNVLCKYHLEWAVKIYKMYEKDQRMEELLNKLNLSVKEIRGFGKVASNMYLPYNKGLNINPQDDSFLKKNEWISEEGGKGKTPLFMRYHPLHLFRHQVCKQADTVLAHFILEDAQPYEVMRDSFLYYEKRTVHDSSLSRCIFSIMAARLHMKEKAVSYLGEALKVDLANLFGNTKDGIHTANMGGSYMAIIHGFGGFRLKEGHISFYPILPENWEGYEFKICYMGRRLNIIVKRKEVQFILEKGSPLDVMIYGREHHINRNIRVPLLENGENIDEV